MTARAGEAIELLATPSLTVDLTGQTAILERAVDSEEISVLVDGKSIPLFWDEGDRWRPLKSRPVSDVTTDWLAGSGPPPLDLWDRRHSPTHPIVAAAIEERKERRPYAILFDGNEQALLVVAALEDALLAGATSDSEVEEHYMAHGAAPLSDPGLQRIALRIAQLMARLHVRGIASRDGDGPGKITWHDLSPSGQKALELLSESFQALGCRPEIVEVPVDDIPF